MIYLFNLDDTAKNLHNANCGKKMKFAVGNAVILIFLEKS
jgi:hypothetical protein